MQLEAHLHALEAHLHAVEATALFLGQVSHTWEKGGSGLVFYTDDVFWEKYDGEPGSVWSGKRPPGGATASATTAACFSGSSRQGFPPALRVQAAPRTPEQQLGGSGPQGQHKVLRCCHQPVPAWASPMYSSRVAPSPICVQTSSS